MQSVLRRRRRSAVLPSGRHVSHPGKESCPHGYLSRVSCSQVGFRFVLFFHVHVRFFRSGSRGGRQHRAPASAGARRAGSAGSRSHRGASAGEAGLGPDVRRGAPLRSALPLGGRGRAPRPRTCRRWQHRDAPCGPLDCHCPQRAGDGRHASPPGGAGGRGGRDPPGSRPPLGAGSPEHRERRLRRAAVGRKAQRRCPKGARTRAGVPAPWQAHRQGGEGGRDAFVAQGGTAAGSEQ